MDMELKKHGDEMRDKILNYIIQYISEHGYSPNYDEIREAVGLKSKSSVHNHVNKMFENGMIETDCGIGTPRAIRVTGYKFVKEEFATDTNVGTNGWIPVEERMPEESLNSVIGWDAYRERCVFVQYLQGQWKLGDWESVNITHWMNVPEPPKGA